MLLLCRLRAACGFSNCVCCPAGKRSFRGNRVAPEDIERPDAGDADAASERAVRAPGGALRRAWRRLFRGATPPSGGPPYVGPPYADFDHRDVVVVQLVSHLLEAHQVLQAFDRLVGPLAAPQQSQ